MVLKNVMNDYPWQQPLWQGFQQAVLTQRLPHAILLHGAKGIGKQWFATQMAKVLLCDAPQAAVACGQCRSCHLWQVGHHADFYDLQPEEPGKSIKVEALREALAWLALSPQQGRAKVLLLIPAEGLNTAASNALLKSLEEPASHTTLILVAEQIASILPTLRSRCQLWCMPTPSLAQKQQWLAQQGIDVATQEHLTDEGPLSLLQRAQQGSLDQQRQFQEDIQAFIEGRLPMLKLSQMLQKSDTARALAWLWQYWQRLANQAALQNHSAQLRRYVDDLRAIQQLQHLHTLGANLNWGLQWDALLCQLKPSKGSRASCA